MNCFDQFTDENITQILLRAESTLFLEEIINRDTQCYLQFKDEPLDYGKAPARKDLSLLLEEVKLLVDDFLGASEINPPTVDYKNLFREGIPSSFGDFLMFFPWAYNTLKSKGHYCDISEHITLKKEAKGKLIPVLAHEYAHHVQRKKISFIDYFEEGQARSVQRHISNFYAEKEDNLTFSVHNLREYDLPELKVAYIWLCGEHGVIQKPYLSQARTEKEKRYLDIAWTLKARNAEPGKHIKGNAFFSILEYVEGTEIHRQITAGKYKLAA